MCDDLTEFGGAGADASGSRILRQISQVLGVPVAAFYGPETTDGAEGDLVAVETDRLLALVRAHLARLSVEDRRAFIEALKAFAEEA